MARPPTISGQTAWVGRATDEELSHEMAKLHALHRDGARVVFGEMYRLTGGDRHRAEDLTQETFVRACASLRRAPKTEVSVGWLVVVARNVFVDGIRKSDRERAVLLRFARADLGNNADPIGYALSAHEANRVLRALSDEHRAVLVFRYLHDLSTLEIATLLGRSRRATESLLVRARHRLNEVVNRQHEFDANSGMIERSSHE